MIDSMHSGNTDAILSGVFADNDIILINAILAGAKHGINKKQFIDGVAKAQNSKTVLLGFPISSVAIAATHYLNGETYTGNDPTIKALIDNKFNI